MGFVEKVKSIFTKSEDTEELYNFISVPSMEANYEEGNYMEAAKNLKQLLERYGERKKKNHRRKGREFIHFILSNKHKDLKNIGYAHWENIEKFIKLNQDKVYEYHKKNLRKAMDFFEKEIKSLNEIKIPVK
ncbi:MAG: hypothetical protein ACLFPM_02840 [Candidatus Izemoplasmatales bacterium]